MQLQPQHSGQLRFLDLTVNQACRDRRPPADQMVLWWPTGSRRRVIKKIFVHWCTRLCQPSPS